MKIFGLSSVECHLIHRWQLSQVSIICMKIKWIYGFHRNKSNHIDRTPRNSRFQKEFTVFCDDDDLSFDGKYSFFFFLNFFWQSESRRFLIDQSVSMTGTSKLTAFWIIFVNQPKEIKQKALFSTLNHSMELLNVSEWE